MRVWAVLLLVPALAGCTDSVPADPATDEVAPSLGGLRGIVVDEAVRPIEGARITIAPGDLQAVTDEDGVFEFDILEPGTYAVSATRDEFLESQIVATVFADRPTPVAKIVLYHDPEAIDPYYAEFHFQGHFECGGGIDDITCSNVNIITWIILGLGNVTNDRSLFLQWIDGAPMGLQTELVWESTQPLGDRLGFAIGGATEEQLSTGMATTHNYTFGPSTLILTIPQPELGESGIGVDRALLTQVIPAPWQDVPGGCVIYDPCGPGLQLFQDFETFTHAFYGFTPAADWVFSEDGSPVPPR